MTELNKDIVMKALENVIDPEIGLPITAMELIDNVNINEQSVSVDFHLTSAYCPPMFVMKMASDIKENLKKIGAQSVQLKLTEHHMAEKLNEDMNK